jgi:hypothetical protein
MLTGWSGTKQQKRIICNYGWQQRNPVVKHYLQSLALGMALVASPFSNFAAAQQPSGQGQLRFHVSDTDLVSCTAPLDACCGGQDSCGESCGQSCAGCSNYLDCCGSGNKLDNTWVTLDYLLWTVDGYDVPALVTSSPPGTDRSQAGVLPGATILFGNQELDDDFRSGGRIRLGHWCDASRSYGFEGSIVGLEQESTNFFAQSDGSTGSLGRPFFNDDPNVNDQDALIIAFDEPGGADAFAGSTRVNTSSNLYSAHLAYRQNVYQCGNHRVDMTAGYRFFRLDEGLQINDNITVDGVAGGIVGTNFLIEDRFNTTNEFHGAELGLVSTRQCGCWTTELIAKLALGNNHREVDISGSTVTTIPGFAGITENQGLLTQSSNIGSFENDYFSVIPEVNANLSYQVNQNWKLTAGYNVIYVTDVVRPGDQIDFNVNGTQLGGALTGPATPAFNFESSDLWVHGLNFGAQFNY